MSYSTAETWKDHYMVAERLSDAMLNVIIKEPWSPSALAPYQTFHTFLGYDKIENVYAYFRDWEKVIRVDASKYHMEHVVDMVDADMSMV